MIVDFKNKFKIFINKLKAVKHIEIYLTIGLAIIILLFYFTTIKSPPKVQTDSSTKEDNIDEKFSSSQEYTTALENKLENVIGSIKGVGNVDVVITLEKGFEYIYVTEEETKTTSNGTIITSKKIILIDGKPVLEKEIYPLIKGVIVIAQGANDVNVKMNILTILQTIIDIDNSKINILEGNSEK